MIFDNFERVQTYDEWINEERDMDMIYLNESLSVSDDVKIETEKLVKFLNDNIHKEKLLDIELFGCPCCVSLDFINIDKKLDNENAKTLYRNHNFGLKTITHINNENGFAKVSFKLDGTVLLENMKIGVFTKSILSHELKHMFINKQINDGVMVMSVITRNERNKKWRELYRDCVSILNNCKNDNYRESLGKNFYKIVYSLYSCTTGEIAAFTQQTYMECEGCLTEEEIKTRLKKSILYEIKESFKTTLNLLNDPNVITDYNNKKDTILPSINVVKELIEKRYKKVLSNYGKVFVLLKDELLDKNNTIDLDIEV